MSGDMSIQVAGNAPANVQIRPGPVYLISLTEGTETPYFIATKLDEGPSTVKVVGLFANKNVKLANIIKNHPTMVTSAKLEDMVEVSFPWHQVISIQNLIYRHKGIK